MTGFVNSFCDFFLWQKGKSKTSVCQQVAVPIAVRVLEKSASSIGCAGSLSLCAVKCRLCRKASLPGPVSSQVPTVRADLAPSDLQRITQPGFMLIQQNGAAEKMAALPNPPAENRREYRHTRHYSHGGCRPNPSNGLAAVQRESIFRCADVAAGNFSVKIDLIERIVPTKSRGTQYLMSVIVGQNPGSLAQNHRMAFYCQLCLP